MNNSNSNLKKDFTMVVIGQIISLFGNNVLRYALPLYLLNITHSASLYGTVMALSFLPLLLLSPVGGLIADRVSKKKIMYVLDFATAALILFYSLTYQHISLVPLLIYKESSRNAQKWLNKNVHYSLLKRQSLSL